MAFAQVLSLRCARQEIRTGGGLVAAAVGIVVGCLLLATGAHNIAGPFFADRVATDTAIHSVTASPMRPEQVVQILTVRMTAPISDQCTRRTFSIAWQNIAGGEDEFWPTGVSMQGGAFSPTADREGRTILVHYTVAGMTPGEYRWRLKSTSTCSWFWGMVTWDKNQQSPVMRFSVL